MISSRHPGSSTYDGRRYGVPIYFAPRVWWYRQHIFDESGLDSSNPCHLE